MSKFLVENSKISEHIRCNYSFLIKDNLTKIPVWRRKYSRAPFLFLIFYFWWLTIFDFMQCAYFWNFTSEFYSKRTQENFSKLNSRKTSQKIFHENECSLGWKFQSKIKEQGISGTYKSFSGCRFKLEVIIPFPKYLFMIPVPLPPSPSPPIFSNDART